MTETYDYALAVLLASAVGLVAVLSNRLTTRIKVPVPLLVLAGAAAAATLFPALHRPSEQTVERVVTVALVLILFDGGMHIGWSRLRQAITPVVLVGVLGTFLTAAGGALLLHVAFGLAWYVALLVATAVAPTDPAVVFSVLGQREIVGRSGTILEGESGANDPVGIALMAGLLAAGGISGGGLLGVGASFVLQMGIGTLGGVLAGWALLWFIRAVPLPSEGLYPLRTLLSAFVVYGAVTLAHGSGFLAVFVAGILIGDGRAPYKREIERFHSAVAGLAEIVAFVLLGLTVDLRLLAEPRVWLPGLVLGAALALVIRPLLIGLCLWPTRLRLPERAFVLFAGLKGAVPILLGTLLLAAQVPDAERLYGIVIVVVAFSVLTQGSLVPGVAHLLRLPMRMVEPEPWALGVRLRDQPEGVHRFTVRAGSRADGRTIDEVGDLVGDMWLSMVVRDGQLVPVRPDTSLQAADEVVILADPELHEDLASVFGSHG